MVPHSRTFVLSGWLQPGNGKSMKSLAISGPGVGADKKIAFSGYVLAYIADRESF
jgi:hypothetical protein